MPIIKSAIKRVRQTQGRTARNTVRKRQLKTVLKDFQTLIDDKKFAEATKLFPLVQKTIDLTVKNNLWHANKGARQKSRLAGMLPKTTPKSAAKPATEEKATPVKKAPAKKPVEKKAE